MPELITTAIFGALAMLLVFPKLQNFCVPDHFGFPSRQHHLRTLLSTGHPRRRQLHASVSSSTHGRVAKQLRSCAPDQTANSLRLLLEATPKEKDELRSRLAEMSIQGTDLLGEMLQLADEVHAHGHVTVEMEIYQDVVKLFPACKNAWVSLGLCYSHDGKYELALEAYDIALEIDHTYAAALYNKGLVLHEMGYPEHALEYFDLALSSPADDNMMADCWFSMGTALDTLKRYDEALHAYDQVVSLTPLAADVWDSRGQVLSQLERFSESIQSHKRALQLCNREDPNVWYNLAVAYAAMGNTGKVRTAFSNAIDLDKHEVMAIIHNYKDGGACLQERRAKERQFASNELIRLPLRTPERAKWSILTRVVDRLRELEADPDWMLQRLIDTKGCDELAYGTTWLESWRNLACVCGLSAAETTHPTMVVLGSSLGLQCFSGHLDLGYASCEGYELLESQVSASIKVANEFCLNAVKFYCQDALDANISSAGLVWLNTYAWSSKLKDSVCVKVLTEAPHRARVLSYEPLYPLELAGHTSCLVLKNTCELDTSWAPNLQAYVYEVERAPD